MDATRALSVLQRWVDDYAAIASLSEVLVAAAHAEQARDAQPDDLARVQEETRAVRAMKTQAETELAEARAGQAAALTAAQQAGEAAVATAREKAETAIAGFRPGVVAAERHAKDRIRDAQAEATRWAETAAGAKRAHDRAVAAMADEAAGLQATVAALRDELETTRSKFQALLR